MCKVLQLVWICELVQEAPDLRLSAIHELKQVMYITTTC